MNESTVSTAFQKLFREMVPGAVVIKHADKSYIGMPDASITYNGKTLWIEYKFIGPKTKGVNAKDFMRDGSWNVHLVVGASPTQYDMMKRLATVGNGLYIFWELDNTANRKKISLISTWNPITDAWRLFGSNQELVTYVLTNYLT